MPESRAVIQVWSAPRAQSGARPLGTIPQHTTGRVSEALTGSQGVTLVLPRAIADVSGVVEGAWLYVSHPRRGVSEWLILTVDDGDGRARDTVTVTAGPLRTALALRGTIRTINTYDAPTTAFTLPALRVDTLMGLYFTPNLVTDTLDWIAFGVSDYSGTIQIGPLAQWTRAQLLDAIEKATGYEFTLTRVGNTGYTLDLVRRRGSTAATVLLAAGRNVDSLQRTRDLVAGVTVAEPRTTAGLPMRDPQWRVQNISGSGPFWVTLTDPAGGPPVIRENAQCVGCFLVPLDGVPVVIATSRASDSSVEVADRTGLVVGGLASIWRTSGGALLDALDSPTGLAARGRVVQSVSVPSPSLYANLLVDPSLKENLALWEVVNASGGGADVFNRSDDRAPTMRINGALGGGVSSLVVDGASADLPIRFGDAMTVEGIAASASTDTNTSAAGLATVPLTVALPSTIGASVSMAWTRGGAVVGTAVTNGVQAAAAASLLLQGLPFTPVLASGDQIIYSLQPATLFVNGQNTLDVPIPNGTPVTVVDTYLVATLTPVVGIRTVVVTWSTTLTAPGTPGDASISLDLANEPVVPTGGFLESRILSYVPTSITYTFTLTGAPPAWSTALVSTPTLTVATGVLVPANATLAWVRAGAVLGTLRCVPGATAVATTIQLTLLSGFGQVRAGDVFSLPAQTLYSAETKFLTAAGAGTISLRANTAGAIADNAIVTIRRCLDYNDAEFGSGVVLRLRGDVAVFPTVYRGTGFALYSPVMRVQSPDPAVSGGSYWVNVSVGLTRWAAESAQAQRGWFCVWDADTGAQVTVVGWGAGAPAFTPVFDVETHLDPDLAVFLTRPARLRFSLHPGGGNVGDGLGGFTFLRWVSATVSLNGLPLALVDGSASNALWHRAQDLIEARSNAARYRVRLSTVAPFAEDASELLTLGGMARLVSPVIGLDVTVRIARVEWAVANEDDIALELQVLTPRLSEQNL